MTGNLNGNSQETAPPHGATVRQIYDRLMETIAELPCCASTNKSDACAAATMLANEIAFFAMQFPDLPLDLVSYHNRYDPTTILVFLQYASGSITQDQLREKLTKG